MVVPARCLRARIQWTPGGQVEFALEVPLDASNCLDGEAGQVTDIKTREFFFTRSFAGYSAHDGMRRLYVFGRWPPAGRSK